MGTLAAIGSMVGAGGAPAAPAPVISAIVAIINGDGTTTITWTTDIAATSVLRSGATTSYGTTASSASAVTSHSQTITADDGVYHYQVESVANGQTATSADKLTMVSSHLLGHYFIYPHAQTGGTRMDIMSVPLANQDGTANGVLLQFYKVTGAAGGALHAIRSAQQGPMYPGVMFGYTPDTVSGTAATYDSSPWRAYDLKKDGSYCAWTVPAWVTAANGMPEGKLDRLVLFGDGAAAGHYEVHRVRATVDTTIAADVTAAGSGYYPTLVTLAAGDELMAGDTVYVRTKAGEATSAKLGSIQAYASAGTFPTNVAHRILNTTSQLKSTQLTSDTFWVDQSSVENAWTIAPAGSTPRLVGGYAHQGPAGTYGQEYPTAETWTRSGAGWTPVQGYQRARLSMARASTVYYDAGNTDIGDMLTTITFRSHDMQVASSITTAVTVDTAALYTPMLPVKSYTTIAATVDGVTHKSPATRTPATTGAFTPTTTPMVAWAYGTNIDAGFGFHAKPAGASTVNAYNTQGSGKAYQRLEPATATNTAANTTYEALGRYFACPAAGPVAPTLAAGDTVIAGDGLTVLIRPTTKTGAITGSTGITLKRGGTSLMTGATTTNNADGTITVVLAEASKVLSGDTITIDVAANSLYDANGIVMAAVTAGSTTNHSTQA